MSQNYNENQAGYLWFDIVLTFMIPTLQPLSESHVSHLNKHERLNGGKIYEN